MIKPEISLELFPPKSENGLFKLNSLLEAFKEVSPHYFSVTFGAGGSTQSGTINTVKKIFDFGYKAVPHISCIGSSKKQLENILKRYLIQGIKSLVVLRGDIPSGFGGTQGSFKHANELVEFARKLIGDEINIIVAAYPEMHPQSNSRDEDLHFFINKIKSGANSAITQYFYNTDAYFYFVDELEKKGINIPIIPGIMPITNYSQLDRFSNICGAEIPRWIKTKLVSYKDDYDSIRAFGLDFISSMCEKLLKGGAPGLHFYTLNNQDPSLLICKMLKNLNKK